MNKKIMAMVLAFVLTLGLCGCQLAKLDGDSDRQKDRLVGVYITTEYVDLFAMEDYLLEDIGSIKDGEIIAPDTEGRLYATFTEKSSQDETGQKYYSGSYDFPDLEGISLAVYQMNDGINSFSATSVDEGICNVFCRVGGSDAGIDGTIWMAKNSGEAIFYLNPVYQTADGQVYLVPGTGIIMSSSTAGRATQKYEETYTVTKNGETIEEQFAVEVAIDFAEPAQTVTVIQMDEQDQEVCRKTYKADSLPEELTPEADTAYLIVQSNTKTGTQRQICQPGDEHTEVFVPLDPQICIPKSIYVNWE